MEHSRFEDIEKIKKLKARYFRYLDKKLWDEWGDLFAEDATMQLQLGPDPDPGELWKGRGVIVERVSGAMVSGVTVHQGHMPEIELTSGTTATGIWAMSDHVEIPGVTLKGYGHYEEDYVKQDGKWKIKNLRLTRLHVEMTTYTL